MDIRKKILTAFLVSGLCINILPVYSYMSPEASALYQQACSAEHQQDLKGAIAKLEQAITVSGGDAMLYTKLAGIYSEIDEYVKAKIRKKIIKPNLNDMKWDDDNGKKEE